MSDTQQRLAVIGGVESALKRLAHISPNAAEHSMIPVRADITVSLEQFGAETPNATLCLRGSVVKVTKVDTQGNPALFSVHKDTGRGNSAPLAVIKPAKPRGYTHKVEFSDAALRHGVVVLHPAEEA